MKPRLLIVESGRRFLVVRTERIDSRATADDGDGHLFTVGGVTERSRAIAACSTPEDAQEILDALEEAANG